MTSRVRSAGSAVEQRKFKVQVGQHSGMPPWQTAQVNPFAHIRECSRPHSCCVSAHSLHFGQWCGALPVFYLHNSTMPRSLSSVCGSVTFSSERQRDFERYGATRVGTHAPAATACAAAAQGRDSAYLRFKSRLLNTLELTVPQAAPGILVNGSRWLDVGAGSGEIADYLTRKYGVRITAYDVAPPVQNKWATDRRGALGAAQRLGFPVAVFDGQRLPAEESRSADVVLFNMVLHHAANSTPALLREAARVSQRWIVVLEDCDVTGDASDTVAKATLGRHRGHEPTGIFRTTAAWVALLRDSTGFALRDWGRILMQSKHQMDYQRFFVAERVEG